MMEFIIVFPIYLVLFGSMFAIGDMLIHSNRLASGDRVSAFDVDGWSSTSAWNFFMGNVFDANREVDDQLVRQDSLIRFPQGFPGEIFADSTGPWTVCAASRVENGYRLPAGGTMGQLLYAYRFFNTTLPVGSSNSMLEDWGKGKRVIMRSKGGNLIEIDDSSAYCYYVLKRRRNVNERNTWRHYTSGLLANNRWITEVADERWHDEMTIKAKNSGHNDPIGLVELNDYSRYPQFINWSE